MPSFNEAILAAAGSRKTQEVVDRAIADHENGKRALVVTFTLAGQREIRTRIQAQLGEIPNSITIIGWYTFLLDHWIRPYQVHYLDRTNHVTRLNFHGTPAYDKFPKTDRRRYLDRKGAVYRQGISDLAMVIDDTCGGLAPKRLARIWDHILIDEVQDLCGWDLEILRKLLTEYLGSVTLVGDPRQAILDTHHGTKHAKYKGGKIAQWFVDNADDLVLTERNQNFRSNQRICDFADSIFPELPGTESVEVEANEHEGVLLLSRNDLQNYAWERGGVQVLRRNRLTNTEELPAINIGDAKGMAFDHVVIFPTASMRTFATTGDLSKLNERERLYVAVTRARYSVGIVID